MGTNPDISMIALPAVRSRCIPSAASAVEASTSSAVARALPAISSRPISRRSQSTLTACGRTTSSSSSTTTTSSSRAVLPLHRRTLGLSTAARYLSSTAARQGKLLPPRSDKFKKITKEDIEAFKGITSGVLSTVEEASTASTDELVGYNEDWMGKYKGESKVVLRPKSTEEVSKLVAYCVKENIAITPQGGNTGLVGGSVPVYDEVILNLSGLNKIRAFDEVSGVLTCDAGCILETLDGHCAEKGYIMPLDLGAKGSCHIGGNVATNAGGLRLVRYGSLHGSVLGLEVVLPDEKGTILRSGMGGLRKDNTGYDLKQLFIGSEGTLGLITGISIMTAKRPTSKNVAVLKVPTFDRVQDVFVATRNKLGEVLSAFEFFDQEAYQLVLHHTGQKAPLEGSADGQNAFYILIETSGSNKDHDDEKLGALMEDLMENEIVEDGVLAQDETQMAGLWSLRESIPEACGKSGKVYKYDLSIPVSKMYDLLPDIRARFQEAGLVDDGSIKLTVGYGHVGDSNLHVNIVAKEWSTRVEETLEPWIYEWVSERNGSISAEHGLGVMKAPYIGYSQPPEAVEMMKKLKAVFDPKGLLNPYKYFL